MLSVKGIYENGKIELLEPILNHKKAKVIVTILEEIEEAGSNSEKRNGNVFNDMIGIISEREDGSTNHDHYLSENDTE